MTEPTTDTKSDKKIPRRDFFKRLWIIFGLISLAELLFFITNLLRPSKEIAKSTMHSTIKVVGNVEDFALGSVTPNRVNKFILIREPDGGFLALSLTCSHLGCSVIWEEANKRFICPCHSSAFDRLGNVINSPAPRALDFFPVMIEEGKVKIDISQQTKRNKFNKSQITYAR